VNGHTFGEITNIPVGKLSVVWLTAQRPLDPKKVAKIAADFDPDAFGLILVCRTPDASFYHVIDGQHRVDAVRGMWGEQEQVPCRVINTTDPRRAADIWAKMNTDRTKPSTIERFRVAVTAGHQQEASINKLLVSLGYEVTPYAKAGSMRAVSTCMLVAKRDGMDILRDALLIIQGTWGKTPESVDGALIDAYAQLLAKYGSYLDRQHLVDKVKKDFQPGQLLGAARSDKAMKGGTLSYRTADILTEVYNRGRRSNRLGDLTIIEGIRASERGLVQHRETVHRGL